MKVQGARVGEEKDTEINQGWGNFACFFLDNRVHLGLN